MSNSEVSWAALYRIDMTGLDGTAVFHLREALREYSGKKELDDDTVVTFERTMEICDRIIKLDDMD